MRFISHMNLKAHSCCYARWCRNVATYRWKEDNGKFKISSFITKFYS